MKYFIIVGERSGDLHGANLVGQLKLLDAHADFVGWGGQQLKESGVHILEDYKTVNFIGLSEVLMNIRFLQNQISRCKKQISEYRPDCLILIDFPGFNLRIAKYAKKIGIKVTYYISPKVWAWNKSRLKLIKSCVDRMMVILPFEKDFYKKASVDVDFVGNPVLDSINQYQLDQAFGDKYGHGSKVALLPGSRPSEVKSFIKIIEQLVSVYEEVEFFVAAVDNVDESLYRSLLGYKNTHIITGQTYDILGISDLAIVTSGTATLEVALFNVPQIVVYKTSTLTYWAARLLLKIPYISLVNLIAGQKLVTELIQGDFSAPNLVSEVELLLTDIDAKKRISEGYSEIRKSLGNKSASENAAKIVYELSCS